MAYESICCRFVNSIRQKQRKEKKEGIDSLSWISLIRLISHSMKISNLCHHLLKFMKQIPKQYSTVLCLLQILPNAGIMVELGIAIQAQGKIIIGINSDIRLIFENRYEVPTYGRNHYVLGTILKHGYFVHSFDESLEKLREIITDSSN